MEIKIVSSQEPWSKDDIQKIQKLNAAGLSWREIAAEFPGRTMEACKNTFYKYLRFDADRDANTKKFAYINKNHIERMERVRQLQPDVFLKNYQIKTGNGATSSA